MRENDDLLEIWEDSIENFLNFTTKWCGIHKESNTYLTLKENILTMQDLAEWIDVFRGDLDEIEYVTEVFMEKKRSAA